MVLRNSYFLYEIRNELNYCNNIKDDSNDEYSRKYLTACLLGFYQQQLVFSENSSKMDMYRLEKPLWIFVGGSVTKSLNKKEASDVVTIISLLI